MQILKWILSMNIIFLSFVYNMRYFSTANHDHQDILSRQERAIVFPPFTVLQFAVGLAVPAQVPNRSIFTNLGTLSNLPLPSKINQLYPYKGKPRQFTHNNFYEIMSNALNWHDIRGEECVLKTICEISNMSLEKNELFFDLLKLLFSPSTIKYPNAKNHYLRAEQDGKTFKNCSELYSLCTHSLVDLLLENIS